MKKNQPKSSDERLPPHNAEAELGVLGCIAQAPLESLNECEESGVNAEWFYDLRHATVYQAALALHKEGVEPEVVTLSEALRQRDRLDVVGGLAFLAGLADQTHSAAHLPAYLDILREKFLARRLIRQCAEAVGAAFAADGEVTDVIARHERAVLELAEARTGTREVAVRQALGPVMEDMERYHRGHAQIKGLTTGLDYLDKLLCGIGGDNGNFVVVSGRPGTGKTSFALDVVEHVALDFEWASPRPKPEGDLAGGEVEWVKQRGLPVAVFSLEMTTTALTKRMLFQRARADVQRWRTGFASSADFPPLTRAAAELSAAKIWIDDTARCTVDEVKAKARRLHRQHGIRLFVVDYIQLMRSGGRRFREDRVQELAEISGELQSLAKELNTPLLVLAQMNRDYEKDPNRTPRLSDLKDCGAIEQDADVVAFLFEARLKEKEKEDYERQMDTVYGRDWSQYPLRTNLLIAKNRYGPTGKCELLFQRSCTHFLDYIVWRKQHGLKAAAAGERQPALAARDDLPTREELGLE